MNKKILSIAVAAAMVAPMAASADTTVYGLIDTAWVYTDNAAGDSWNVEQGNGSSRLGFKGSEDLGGGMKAIFQLEFGLQYEGAGDGNYGWGSEVTDNGETAINNRLAIVGLTGGFGTVALGRQWTPYYQTVATTNIMNVGGLHDYYGGMTRTGDAVAYVTPNMGGFQGKVAMISDGASGEDAIDAYNISLDYSNGPITAGVSFLEFGEDDAGVDLAADRWGIGASYTMGAFKVSGEYEDIDDADDTDVWALGVVATFGNNQINAVYGEKEGDTASLDEWAIGLQHNFSKRTRVYVEYGQQDNGSDEDTFGVGLRHNF